MAELNLDHVTGCYMIVAKTDEGDGPFDVGSINQKFPTHYALIEGHAWVVWAPDHTKEEVAQAVGLVPGGKTEASGVVVPMLDYTGFADNKLWDLIKHPDQFKASRA